MKRILLAILFLVTFNFAQDYTQQDIEICNSKFELAVKENLSEEPIGLIVTEIGKSFLGLGYEGGTLDKNEDECLVVHLTGLDCYTFLETSLVFARLIKKNKNSFENFTDELTCIRYRNGKLENYTSRLHYFSDWIYEMDKAEVVKDVTKDIGGMLYNNEVNFMSTNPQYYHQLESNPELVNNMKRIEKNISKREYYFIPQENIEKYEHNIHNGDIIGITTNIAGLDISHTGIAVKLEDNRIHFMHAPSTGKKIQITKETLAEYIKRNTKQTGIIIVRPLEPSLN